MTTIAYNHRDREMASDGQATSGWVVSETNFTKIHRVEEGWAAFAGKAADLGAYIKLLNGEEVEGDKTKLECDAIVVPDHGTPYKLWFDSLGCLVKVKMSSSWALGSGREYALGAMEAGASAKDAVKAAIKYDVFSGGRVVVKKRGDLK